MASRFVIQEPTGVNRILLIGWMFIVYKLNVFNIAIDIDIKHIINFLCCYIFSMTKEISDV